MARALFPDDATELEPKLTVDGEAAAPATKSEVDPNLGRRISESYCGR